jgi:hypothetical protein
VRRLAPRESIPYEPHLLISERKSRSVPDLSELSDRGVTFAVEWDWSDKRVPFPWVFRRPKRHRDRLSIVVDEFRRSVHGEPNVLKANLQSVLEDIRDDMRNRHRQDQARQGFKRPMSNPEAQAHFDRLRLQYTIGRARALLRLLWRDR